MLDGLFEASYATISADGLYRYTLGRRWAQRPPAVFVMLNPSTADAETDDPTIRRCIGFAKSWGCGGIHVVNLYAYRATRPKHLWEAEDPIGPDNDDVLRMAFHDASDTNRPVVAAWGAHGPLDRAQFVHTLAHARGVTMQAFALTKNGSPKHPLYLSAESQLRPYSPPSSGS